MSVAYADFLVLLQQYTAVVRSSTLSFLYKLIRRQASFPLLRLLSFRVERTCINDKWEAVKQLLLQFAVIIDSVCWHMKGRYRLETRDPYLHCCNDARKSSWARSSFLNLSSIHRIIWTLGWALFFTRYELVQAKKNKFRQPRMPHAINSNSNVTYWESCWPPWTVEEGHIASFFC